MTQRPSPVLVTGVPRAGTTWLARLLASSPGTALAGREPMNPRGRQYALGGTLSGWTRLTSPSARQKKALRRCYQGRNLHVYSRYGKRQWQAVLPRTRVVIKDPFALLSIPAIVRLTGAQPVVLYRHPGAALASYRRMGWTPDNDELTPIVGEFLAQRHGGETFGVTPSPSMPLDDVSAMAWFWNSLHGLLLADLADIRGAVVVSHEALAVGGAEAAQHLFSTIGLAWSKDVELALRGDGGRAKVNPAKLHNLDRQPGEVAHEWRSSLTDDEVARLNSATVDVRRRLRAISSGP